MCFYYVFSVKKMQVLFLWVVVFLSVFVWILYRIENEADVSTDVTGASGGNGCFKHQRKENY